MPNSLAKVVKYLPDVLDDVAMMASVTGVIPDGLKAGKVKASGIAGTYNLLKVAFDKGLTNYNKETGFTVGGVTTTWEPKTATVDRQKSFLIDAIDDAQAGDIAIRVMSEFIRVHVVPELDAYRLATYATAAGTKVTAASYTKTTAKTAIDVAMETLFNANVDPVGAILFCSAGFKNLLEESVIDHRLDQGEVINHKVSIYNGLNVVAVPSTRFYTAITLNSGATGGYAKASAGADLHFLLVKPEAVIQLIQHNKFQSFSPDQNQTADAYRLNYRVFGDAWVLENGATGIYSSAVGA